VIELVVFISVVILRLDWSCVSREHRLILERSESAEDIIFRSPRILVIHIVEHVQDILTLQRLPINLLLSYFGL